MNTPTRTHRAPIGAFIITLSILTGAFTSVACAEPATPPTAATSLARKRHAPTKGNGTWNNPTRVEYLPESNTLAYTLTLHMRRKLYASEPDAAYYQGLLQDIPHNAKSLADMIRTLGTDSTGGLDLIASDLEKYGKTSWHLAAYHDSNAVDAKEHGDYFEITKTVIINPGDLSAIRDYLDDHANTTGKPIVDALFAGDQAALDVVDN